MNNITLQDLIEQLKIYNPDEIENVTKSYNYANFLHRNQKRESGEAYITHPLNVAYILTEMHADGDTLCAALLHDTLEDCDVSKEDIATDFNETIANLVDGVTKISKLNFSSETDHNMANTRKIIVGITNDVRIILIKLADRLHNMRTLNYKSEFKQKENALETMEIFVPLAYYIGAYRIKTELEDLSFKYLYPDKYKETEDIKQKVEDDSHNCLREMLYRIQTVLNDKEIPNEIKVRTKNIYGIYKRLNEGHKISDIHDLLSLKIMVDNIANCYRTLGLIHREYHPINDRFKDYICNPKTNMYRSLHTTVFGPDDRLVQTQIRTFDMDRVASFGLSAYWDIEKGNARYVMQAELREKYQFFKSLAEMNSIFGDNQEFVYQVKSELFSDKIYVYTSKGDIIELPKDATAIDFAYKIHTDIGDNIVSAVVNDEIVNPEYVLHNKDRVRIITDNLASGPKEEWYDIVQTAKAKQNIRSKSKNQD